ncbi:MAG: hypothetical protein OFPII_04760 [Osedax symbiont Rs1]|nr:MAG: hypothetical protein OFPII_04760 [Osedax symbiont Rs1]
MISAMKSTLQNSSLNLIRSYWQSADQSWHYPAYQRPYNWLIYTVSGRGLVQLDDYSIELLPNTLALLPLQQSCHYRCIEPMQIGACAFNLELSTGLDLFQVYTPPTSPVSFTDQAAMTSVIASQNSNQEYFQALAAIYQMLAPIIADSRVKTAPHAENQRLSQILEHINQHLTEPLSIPELAYIHGTSTAHFSRWFSALTATSPKKFINQKRVDLACKLLISSTLSVEKIAYNCGYQDPLYFSKCFKRFTKQTPTEYRNNQTLELFPEVSCYQ